MISTTCRHCWAETTNGLVLCDLCQAKVLADLEYLPIYFRNLARWRPGRAGARPVPGSREPVAHAGGTDRVGTALDEAYNTLTTWARVLVDHRPYLARLLDRLVAADLTDAENVRWLCLGFARYLTSMATLDWCGEFVTEVSKTEAALRRLTEAVAPGWYAGSCRRCSAPTYVAPGLTWVTCRGCGSTTHAGDHLDVIVDEARDWIAPPMRLAEAIVALVDGELNVARVHDRIRKWSERGRIESTQRATRAYEWSDAEQRIVVVTQPAGPKRYRLGDVLDRLERATRQASDGEAEAS